jgi:hypothetical protein
VSARVLSATGKEPVVGFYEAWKSARDSYVYEVDLRRFKDAAKHPGFFDRHIRTDQIEEFESSFRSALVPDGRIERGAEVVYWKNAKNHKARDRITQRFLGSVNSPAAWMKFVDAVRRLASSQTWESLKNLTACCGQKYGLAVPVTFLSFFAPDKFPMADRRVAKWWSRFPEQPQFKLNGAVVAPRRQSWEAYVAWTDFCRRQAAALSELGGMPWRARDVEMAIWTDTDAKLPLME